MLSSYKYAFKKRGGGGVISLYLIVVLVVVGEGEVRGDDPMSVSPSAARSEIPQTLLESFPSTPKATDETERDRKKCPGQHFCV